MAGAERKAVSAMLGRAFAGDDALRWVLPGRRARTRRAPGLFRLIGDSAARSGRCEVAGEGAAAAFWRAPEALHPTDREMWGLAWPMLRTLGTALPRALRLDAAIRRRHPPGRFWYLAALGTEPSRQRMGLAAALLRHGIARADDGRTDCLLETASERNRRFYERFGFATVDAWQVTPDLRFWTMVRRAR